VSRYQPVSGRAVRRALRRLGFEVRRTSGSHVILGKAGHPKHVAVPVHSNRPLPRGTFESILRDQAGISKADFYRALDE
jgi:predicted RNA binding protein YcfA (HicA-like mRNA interferase family)